jgi:tRNA nucleotidyltransferase (CCA-adding enzyme)
MIFLPFCFWRHYIYFDFSSQFRYNYWQMSKSSIPEEVIEVSKTLTEAGFEAYLVGGCVRDILLKREPKDWDIATNATPKEIQGLFDDTVYENDFGTVGIKVATSDKRQATRKEKNPMSHVPCPTSLVEVTTYRIEGKYSDKRHPDEVKFAKTIEEDLSRRDFTVNALAMDLEGNITDPFGGKKDLKGKVIRTVGKPEDRFAEDALRLMRAVRFAAELDFIIEPETRVAVSKLSGELEMIAKERIRDEFTKMIMARDAARGILLLEELGLLKHVMPELREGLGVGQNKHHIYQVFEHNLRALDYTAKEGYALNVRIAALLHDVGKPRSKAGEGIDSTFYQHEYIGARMAIKALDRLHFSRDFIENVAHLVRRHMFYYNVGEISPAGVRRFVARVGTENIDDLLKVREADRIGSGVKKAIPYKLRHLLFMIEKVKRDPLSPKMLVVKGEDVMDTLNLQPSPRVGWILGALLEEVLEDPKKNERTHLMNRVKALGSLSDDALRELAQRARDRKDELEGEAEEEIKRKHHV